ncbi:MAG: hypothetical protein J6Q55_00780, partial [Clostridia bacterium]|nr:hypothetical protein [Clostridia bacterium]
DIMNNGTDSLIEQLTEIKLGELFEMLGQENAEGIMATLSQFSIKELMDGAYNSLSLGDLLGYKRYQNDGVVESGSIVEFLDTEGALLVCVAKIGSQMVKSADSQTWYNAKLACTEQHEHQIDCYEYLWYLACPDDCVEDHEHVIIEERAHTLAEGIFGVIVDVTIEQISNNPNSLVDKLYEVKLADLLGDDAEGLMATLGEYTIKDLMDPSTLEEIGLADVLNYIRCDITTQVTPANGWDTDIIVDDGTTIVKYNSITDQYAYLDAQDMRWYKAQMHCREQTHAHEIGCYGYIWYAECNNGSCEEHKDHFALQDKTYGQVEGIYAVLADLSIGDISNGTDIMDIITNRLTLGDIFGDGMPDMLKTLKDTPIADLESQLNTIKVGNLLGYSYNKELGRWEKDVGGVMQPLESVEKIIADKTLDDLKDFNSILEEIKLGDVLDPVPDMLSKLTDTPITQLGDQLDTLLVGDFLGYSHLSVDVAAIGWAEVADIDGLYEHTDGRLALLADDGIHYSAQLVCDDEHPHTIDCYDLEWFDKCEDG